ncbi:MAG TPA: iron donor protein CyaY [Acidobacteriota bacterium]|nr:iron donor protein CyaY [Acidobacteriota bacterium]
MLNENEFKDHAVEAIEELEERLIPVSEDHDFEVESGGGMLTLCFEEPSEARFIISPNAAARQIWVSALATSYKFDWDEEERTFVLDKTREPLTKVIGELISRHLGKKVEL